MAIHVPRRGLWGAVLLAALLASAGAGAEERAASARPPAVFERPHESLSLGVEELSQKIDSLLGGERANEESTGSYVRAGGSLTLREGGELRFDHLFRVRLVLPNTQERFRLLLESDAEDELRDERDAQARKAGESVGLKEERGDASDYAAALQFVLEEKRRWRLSSAAGVQLRMPPEPFVRLRGRRQVALGDWVLRAAETLFWYESRGAGEGTQVDFERALGEGVLFRSTSEAVWVERRGRFELGQSLSVFQELTERDVLRYRARLSGETEPNTHVEEYGASIRYRRRLYSTWVFLEIEPDLAFEKANDFRGEASLRFLVETVFGAEYVDGGEAGRPVGP